MIIMEKIQKQKKHKFRIALILCFLLLLGLFGCAGRPQSDTPDIDNSQLKDYISTSESDTDVESSEKESIHNKISWNGKVYEYNDHLSNFLFIGVDREELAEVSLGSSDAGRADALFLVSWDRVSHDITVVSIPRDTIATINVFDRDGTDLGPVEQHICLAYSYGEGKHESCRLTKEAVSRLFYRIPIQGYCAITMEAIAEISSILGPVTVTLPNDSLVKQDARMKKGAQVEITEDNAEWFVRSRDITEDNTALYRQERQNAYLEACYQKLLLDFEADPDAITDMYEGLSPYMVTNMGNDQFVKIMDSIVQGGEMNRWTIPGEGISTEVFDEFHVDEDAFYEQILESFFEEAK